MIVHSFGSAAPPFTVHSSAFQSALVEKMGDGVDLDEVSLDMARYGDPDMQSAIVDYLEKRQVKWKPDLVVPIGSPAGIFVAENRDRLFPDTPVLYTSLDRRLLPPNALEKNAAYIGQIFDIPKLIDDMLQIAPDTRNIAVVAGATSLEKSWVERFRKAAEPFAGKINVTYFNNLSFEQMLQQSAKLPPHSYIFLLLLLRDAAGVTYNADEALQKLHAVANAPINSIFDHQMGLGIVGGRLYQSQRIGKEAAEIAVRILHGEPASSFSPVIVPPLPPMYDWRELQRWKVNEKNLPRGSKILFRAPTPWQQYRFWIISGISVFIAQALLIAGLLINLFRRRGAERSLAESEARFRTMADAAPVLIWMSGPDKLCTFFNKAWLEFTGRTMEQERGNGWSEGVHADDFDGCLKTYVKAFDARESFVMQYRLRNHKGEFRSVTDKGVPRFGTSGDFRGYVGACVDVTDLLQQQKTLQEFKQRVALAAEAAHVGVWELNTVTNELWVSDEARDLFRFDRDTQVTYQKMQERVHPADRARRDAAVKNAVKTQAGYEIDYRILYPDETLRWIAGRARCLPDESGKLTRLIGVSMDVTEREEAQELFQLATEASPNGTVLVDDKGRIILTNKHIEDLFGYDREELIGNSIDLLVPERFLKQHLMGRTNYISLPEHRQLGVEHELLGLRKDGTEFPVEIGLNPVHSTRGMMVLTTVTDLTARKRAEAEVQQRREEVVRLSRINLLGEMTASIAHELNQPLSGIMSNAGAAQRFIDRGNVDLGEIREVLVDIAADARRASDVINRIRNTVKKGAAVRERIDLNEVVKKVARMVHPDARLHSCQLEMSLEKNLPSIEGDPIEIQQVLINLTTNAFDAMRETPFSKRQVEISTGREDGLVSLTLRDHGAGISDEAKERMFEQFFTTKEDGLGMGLAIVRSIIESHGGKIAVENVDGGGAKFYLKLPISDGAQT